MGLLLNGLNLMIAGTLHNFFIHVFDYAFIQFMGFEKLNPLSSFEICFLPYFAVVISTETARCAFESGIC